MICANNQVLMLLLIWTDAMKAILTVGCWHEKT